MLRASARCMSFFLLSLWSCTAVAGQESAQAVEMSVEDARAIIDRVGKGRSLQPESWPGGARVAVLLSFDADDETVELRTGGNSITSFRTFNMGVLV